MENLKMHTPDLADENFKKLAALFPNAVTETKDENGNVVRAIDADVLRQEISATVVEGPQERYQFTWPDKKKSVVLANQPIAKTLRLDREKSVGKDGTLGNIDTENIYIEGDNLEVLKLLQSGYHGKVKMVYIDPPYNTGKDFVYKDKFGDTIENYKKQAGLANQSNADTSGRYHSDWCSMMYPRLRLARELLSDDGVIFISIDDNEDRNLRIICDEVFGETNFLAQCVRKRRNSQANLSKNISPIHEYILIYAKNNGDVLNRVSANIDESEYKNPDDDPRGPYKTMPCTNKGGSVYSVITPTGRTITEEWRFKKDTYEELLADNRLVFPRGGEGKPRYKLFLSEKMREGQLANTWFDGLASNQEATKEIKELFNSELVFDTPKPVGLIDYCIRLASKKNAIILDFFSGSATTAEAAMRRNTVDFDGLKFILVQIPEKMDSKYATLCDIGEERIRRAGDKIKAEVEKSDVQPRLGEEPKRLPDIGFRVFSLDRSGIEKPQPGQLVLDVVKPDRSDMDIVFEMMLKWGLELTLPVEKEEVAGYPVYSVACGELVCCLADGLTMEVLDAIADMEPRRVLMRDSILTDTLKLNAVQAFKRVEERAGYEVQLRTV